MSAILNWERLIFCEWGLWAVFYHFLSGVRTRTSCSYIVVISLNVILLLCYVVGLSNFSDAFYKTPRWSRCMWVLYLFYIWVMGMAKIASTVLDLLMLMSLKLKIIAYAVTAVVLRNWCSNGDVISLMLRLFFVVIENRLEMSFGSGRALIFGLNRSIKFTLSRFEESSLRILNLTVSVSLIYRALIWDNWVLLKLGIWRGLTKPNRFSWLLHF